LEGGESLRREKKENFFGTRKCLRNNMPPFLPRKRLQKSPPAEPPKGKRAKKPSLFDTLDSTKPSSSVEKNKKFVEALGGSDSDTSLSDAGSLEFEDALPSAITANGTHDDDEEIDWEDAIAADSSIPITPAPVPFGDLELTLDASATRQIGTFTNPHDKKQGPSKIERTIRTFTHCMHVQFLLFHNLIRNGWVCDKEVQTTLVGQLPQGVKEAVSTWEIRAGISHRNQDPTSENATRKGRKDAKGKSKVQKQRNWGRQAEPQATGEVDMSRGDPTIRLLKLLARYWKRRFHVTAPGLRKQGYKALDALEEEMESFRNDKHDPEEHGEWIQDLQEFRRLARRSEGSRDVGAQLFTALIRGLGIEARMVASLQPVGYGWSKAEEAHPKKKKVAGTATTELASESEADSSVEEVKPEPNPKANANAKPQSVVKPSRGQKETPIDLSDDSSLTSADEKDDDSVIDITPSTPRRKSSRIYDKDLQYPIYWTEVISPVTSKVIAVDPLTLEPMVFSTDESFVSFEPRGKAAIKGKQVIAYVVAFSQDGTAKDVTTRYLKRHVWPGQTKNIRMPVQKIAIKNKQGKVRHHIEHDWFKQVMRGYSKPDNARTTADDVEDATDLKPVRIEKKDVAEGDYTLQWPWLQTRPYLPLRQRR
jgi:xeroderma pigmentosum group C-complementing protein